MGAALEMCGWVSPPYGSKILVSGRCPCGRLVLVTSFKQRYIGQASVIIYILAVAGLCLVVEMLRYDFLSRWKRFMIVLGAFYVAVGVFLFTDSEVQAIIQDITGKKLI